jgi:hypothetical protein
MNLMSALSAHISSFIVVVNASGEGQMDGDLIAIKADNGVGERGDRRAKFVELAESRTVNAIRAIRVIGKLGNKSAYEYDDADVRKIIGALTKEVDALRARMSAKNGKNEVKFKL